MFIRKRPIVVAILGILATVALLVTVTSARLQTSREATPVKFGLIGIAPGQVARINAVNAVQGIGPTPFRVRLGFVDADGRSVHDRAGNEITLEPDLMPGKGLWLDLEATVVLSLLETRKQIRPLVSVIPVPNDGEPVSITPVIATLELFNRLSGRTEILYVPVQ